MMILWYFRVWIPVSQEKKTVNFNEVKLIFIDFFKLNLILEGRCFQG